MAWSRCGNVYTTRSGGSDDNAEGVQDDHCIGHKAFKMRLVTHNMLQCHVKGCNTNNFPLKIQDAEVVQVEADFSSNFLKNVLGKLDWGALTRTATEVGQLHDGACDSRHFAWSLY